MLFSNAFAKPKATFLIFAALTLLNTVMLCQAATQTPDPANIPRAEPIKQLPFTAPAEIRQQQQPPQQPTASDADVKLIVDTFIFSGNQSISSEQLGALLKDYTQREIGLKALHETVKIITDHYRQKGFFLAQAYLPAQDINENKVEISILEGTLDALKFKANGSLNNKFTAQMAEYNLKPGDAVTENNLVRNIALLNSLPALKAIAQLNPGQAIGSTAVEIELQPLARWVGFASVNTYGNRFTGREVGQAGISLNNLADVGDQLIFNLKSSKDEGLRGLQLAYYVPVHASGTLLNLAYNYVDYKLGAEFKALNAFGSSQYFNIGIDQPLIKNARYGLTARFGGSYKAINDEVSASRLKNQRDITGFDIGLLGDWFDISNDSNYQLGLNLRAGQMKFKDDYARSLDASDAKTEGNFVKYSLAASRVQYFNNGYSLALRADYQTANKNLDSAEKFSIGGVNRWRAFSELPSIADGGFMMGADIRKNISAGEGMASILMETLSPYVFIDLGKGRVNQNALSSNNHVKSIHYGLGLDAVFKQKWLLSVVASHQQQDADGARVNNETRVWGQLQKEF